MNRLIKISLLLLITTVMSYGQKKTLIDKSFSTDKNTTAIFNIDNNNVIIEESTDGKIHFNYTIEFDGFSKKEIREKVEQIKVDAGKFENHITLTVTSKSKMSGLVYTYNAEGGLILKSDLLSKKRDTVFLKSKDSLIKELFDNSQKKFSKPFEYFNKRFKTKDKDGKLINVRKSNVDIMRSQFKIKIPPYMKITIVGKDAEIKMTDTFRNEFNLGLKGGMISVKELYNVYNKFKIEDATFQAYDIDGGDFEFNNIRKGKIGSLKNTNISSEFSEIELGEIHQNVTITDFNGEYYFYNWAKDFERFNLYSEYSKIHFFYPKDDYAFKVFGNNTKNFVGKYEINMQPNSKGEKFNMMERKSRNEGHFSGNIFFDIIHGIIYSYEDSIKTINKD